VSENRLPYLRCVIPAPRPVDVETKGASFQLDAEARAKSLEKRKWNGGRGQVQLQNSILYIECQPAFFKGAAQNGRANSYSSVYNGFIACPCSSWPLTTGHYPLHCRNPVPPSPARVSETCYTAGSSPDTTRLGPNAMHTHICPPTMPRPPTMSTSSELNVRTLPPAHIAPGAAATNRQ